MSGMVIYNIPKQRLPKDETIKTPFTTLEEIIACVEGKTQGKSTRPGSPANNLRIKNPR
jgi:hypothetical protein